MIEATEITLSNDGTRAVVTVRSDKPVLADQIEELQSASARETALKAAAVKGIKGSPGISGWPQHVHPRNKDGKSLDDVKGEDGKPLPLTHPDMQPAYYQATFEITAKV